MEQNGKEKEITDTGKLQMGWEGKGYMHSHSRTRFLLEFTTVSIKHDIKPGGNMSADPTEVTQ